MDFDIPDGMFRVFWTGGPIKSVLIEECPTVADLGAYLNRDLSMHEIVVQDANGTRIVGPDYQFSSAALVQIGQQWRGCLPGHEDSLEKRTPNQIIIKYRLP